MNMNLCHPWKVIALSCVIVGPSLWAQEDQDAVVPSDSAVTSDVAAAPAEPAPAERRDSTRKSSAEAPRAEAVATQASGPTAWQPDERDPDDYRDIVDYNIFKSDREAIARRVERQRNPEPPPTRIVEAPPPPKHPDFDYILVGVTLRGDERIAYIENRREAGQVTQVVVPGDFSEGRLVAIDHLGVIYQTDDQPHRIDVGQNLKGEGVASQLPSKIDVPTPEPTAETPQAQEQDRGEERRRFSPEDFQRFRERRSRD